MAVPERPLEWVGSSYKDLMALPADVRRFFGYALSLAQAGDQHDAAKVLKGFGSAGVREVVEDDRSGTYRAVQRSGLRAALLSQEKYEGNRHVETRSRSHPGQAESG